MAFKLNGILLLKIILTLIAREMRRTKNQRQKTQVRKNTPNASEVIRQIKTNQNIENEIDICIFTA